MQTPTLVSTLSLFALIGCAPVSPHDEEPAEDVPDVDAAAAALEYVDDVAIEGPFFSYYFGFDYDNGDREVGDCSSLFSMAFYKPEGDGPFPLYVHTVGTMTWYRSEHAVEQHLKRMAARGFVAVTVSYDNWDYRDQSCDWYPQKAHCIYDETRWSSATSILSLLSYVDATRIVTGGHSQGAHISILSGDSNTSILAAQPTGATPTERCLNDFALPRERIRLGNGEHEDRHGCGSIWGAVIYGPEFNCDDELLDCNRPKIETLADLSCSEGETQCFREDGSGWFIVTDEDLGRCAHHGYQQAVWESTDAPWGRDANHDWLEAMAFSE